MFDSSTSEAHNSNTLRFTSKAARLMSTQLLCGAHTVAITCNRTERRANIDGQGWLLAILQQEGVVIDPLLLSRKEDLLRDLATLVSPALAVSVIVIENGTGRRSKLYNCVLEGY